MKVKAGQPQNQLKLQQTKDDSIFEQITLCGLESSYEPNLRNHNDKYSLTKRVKFAKLRKGLTSNQWE